MGSGRDVQILKKPFLLTLDLHQFLQTLYLHLLAIDASIMSGGMAVFFGGFAIDYCKAPLNKGILSPEEPEDQDPDCMPSHMEC
jgi:hypothetical protein